LGYSSLNQVDFSGDRLLGSGKILVFSMLSGVLFAIVLIVIWLLLLPFLKVFRVDLSDEDNPLWASLEIRRIPT
jgi:hypothetical protein